MPGKMRSWVRRMSPLLLWFAYLAGYPQLVDLTGAFAPLVGLLPVAVVGWAWGAWEVRYKVSLPS